MDTLRFLDSVRKRCYNSLRSTTQLLGKHFQESLETGHGNDGYIDSGEQVLESL